MKNYDVAIIGAGTSGLSARREVARLTDNYVVIDHGELGTTCARVGCMPSKVLIQVAEDFHRRRHYDAIGITGAEDLSIDTTRVMSHVRSLRDRFVRGVRSDMESWVGNHLLRKRARFTDPNTLDLGDEKIRAERIVIATGSTPVIPGPWQPYRKYLTDTDKFFELPKLPDSIGIIGLGVIGLELGLALARLGIRVEAVTLDKAFGGLTDPCLQEYCYEQFKKEMPIHLQAVTGLGEDNGQLKIQLEDGQSLSVDAALVTMGRRPNLAGLGIEELGIPTDRGIPEFDKNTFRVSGTPWYIAGDVNGTRPVLHEAADEGRIAGYNSVRSEDQCFRRRTPLMITFSSPNVAMVGETHKALTERNADFVTGSVSYEGQGRAIVKLEECGELHVYVGREDGLILGAEMLAPNGEHLAHLLAWAASAGLNVHQVLSLPFYHPVLEEGLRTALRDAAAKTWTALSPLEVLRCSDPPVGVQV